MIGILRALEIFASDSMGLNSQTSTLSAPAAWLVEAGAQPALSGVSVSPKSALAYAPANACIRVLAETLATPPLVVMQRTGERSSRRAREHPLYSVLHDQFNPEMTSYVGRVTGQGHIGGWGNAYFEIEFDDAGFPVALWPLLPDRTFVLREARGKVVRTRINDREVGLPAARVLHVYGLGFDGLSGYSPVKLSTQSIGLGLALEANAATFFGNASRPAGFLTSDKPIKEDRAKKIQASFEMLHQGFTHAHRVAVLEDGLKFDPLTVNPEDAQLIEARKFQVEEQCRPYRMPPHMIQHLDKATFSNIEHQGIEFVQYTMLPWFTCWEQAINMALFSEQERKDGYFAKFIMAALLRGDAKAQADAFMLGRQWGWLSADDVREMLEMNPLPDGQGASYLIPMNMIDAKQQSGSLGEKSEEPPAAAPADSPPEDRKGARSATLRNRYRLSARRVLGQAAERVVRKEVNHARRQLGKLEAGGSAVNFEREMETFWADIPATIRREMLPGVEMLADLLREAVAAERGAAESPNLPALLANLVTAAAERYVRESRAECGAALAENRLAEMLADWLKTRAATWVQSESVRLASAITMHLYRAAGVGQLRWYAFKGAQPSCRALHGKQVALGEEFAAGITHPPLDKGCDCTVVAA